MAKKDLVPFKKGDDPRRNTTGKNKGSFSLLKLLKTEIQKCPKGQNKKTYAFLMVKKMLDEAIKKGDIQHIKTIWNYIEGMPKQSTDIDLKAKVSIEINKEIAEKNEITPSTTEDSN